MKVIVTGAAGYIGSNLSKRLSSEDHELILIDNFSRGKQKYLDYLGVKTRVTRMDLRLYDDYFGFFEGADVVFHTAGKIGGNQFLHGSPLNELNALQENLAIDRNVFRACVECNIKKIIYTSSISVYNTSKQYGNAATFSENDFYTDKLEPEGGYGWAKVTGEKQLGYMSQSGTKVGIARIFKSFGPCDDYSEESGQVVCSLMRKAINYPKEKFVLWGDGSVTRCLVYIDDLIDGLLKLEKHLDKESLTINMGGNISHTMRALASKIIQISGKDIQIENDMSMPVGVTSRIPNLELAKEKLNWQPTTSLEDGLKKTYKWMEQDLCQK